MIYVSKAFGNCNIKSASSFVEISSGNLRDFYRIYPLILNNVTMNQI